MKRFWVVQRRTTHRNWKCSIAIFFSRRLKLTLCFGFCFFFNDWSIFKDLFYDSRLCDYLKKKNDVLLYGVHHFISCKEVFLCVELEECVYFASCVLLMISNQTKLNIRLKNKNGERIQHTKQYYVCVCYCGVNPNSVKVWFGLL